jgi:hypothetical protein
MLLYYTKINFAEQGNSGIIKKVFSQVKAFRESGVPCNLFYFENNSCVLEKNDGTKQVWAFENKWKRIWFQYFSFLQYIDFQQYTAIYIRHFFLHPLAILMLRQWKKTNPKVHVIMEIASYPYHEQARKDKLKERITYGLDKWLTPLLHRYVNQILTFSPYEKIYQIPTLRTSNGIDTDGIEVVKIPNFNKELHILGLANVQHWHGFDRVIAGLKAYYSSDYATTVYFHIVGRGDEIPKLEKMVDSDILRKHIIFHGAKYGADLQRFFDESHIAVSSLGMHRIGVANGETSNLKVREYCARGIPFINGYLDRDLPTAFPYVFQVAADEQLIDIQEVIHFYKNLYVTNQHFPEELNAFAKANLTWKAKLQVVVKALSHK